MSCVILFDVEHDLNHIVQVNALYLVWVKESRASLHVPGLSQGVQCTLYMYQVTFAVQDAPGLSKRVQGTLYIYLDTLHTAQDVQGLNKQPRAQFKSHQVKVKQLKANGLS